MIHKTIISTSELARLLHIKPASIRHRYCLTGSYFGIKPIKLPNGRLAWPQDQLDKILATDTPQSSLMKAFDASDELAIQKPASKHFTTQKRGVCDESIN